MFLGRLNPWDRDEIEEFLIAVEIYNDDDEHIASTEQCKQTNLWMIGNEYIQDLPLTDYLAYDIEHETREIPEKEPCNEDMEFDSMRDYERLHKNS